MTIFTRKQNCGYVAINAAFLQEVKEAYSSVWDRLIALRESAQRGLPLSVDLNQWVAQLSELRESLGTIFSLEETYGYMPQASRPTALGSIDPSVTCNQHAELYLQLSEMCEQVEEAQYRGTLLRDFPIYAETYFRFVEFLQEHERLESLLIEQGLRVASGKSSHDKA